MGSVNITTRCAKQARETVICQKASYQANDQSVTLPSLLLSCSLPHKVTGTEKVSPDHPYWWLQTETRSITFPWSSHPALCVYAGCIRASRLRAPGVVSALPSITCPLSLYGNSWPGCPRWARYRSPETPQGGPLVEGSLSSGHSRQTSLPPSGLRRSDILLAYCGRASGGRAQKNWQ